VIEFVLDGRSKVATYMQLVQQVRQALRVGLAREGDQLPKVRDVAQSLAINPNTVLKAYRQLELEGLAEGRPGVGTFLVGTLAGPARSGGADPADPANLADMAELRDDLLRWLARAGEAGLSRDDVVALIETTMRVAPPAHEETGKRA
jgi:GntR family transcriptional regulator